MFSFAPKESWRVIFWENELNSFCHSLSHSLSFSCNGFKFKTHIPYHKYNERGFQRKTQNWCSSCIIHMPRNATPTVIKTTKTTTTLERTKSWCLLKMCMRWLFKSYSKSHVKNLRKHYLIWWNFTKLNATISKIDTNISYLWQRRDSVKPEKLEPKNNNSKHFHMDLRKYLCSAHTHPQKKQTQYQRQATTTNDSVYEKSTSNCYCEEKFFFALIVVCGVSNRAENVLFYTQTHR